MNKFAALNEYLVDHPTATYQDMKDAIGLSSRVVSVYINRLIDRGFIKKEGDRYEVLKLQREKTDSRTSKAEYKLECIVHVVDQFLEDFDSASSYEERDIISKRVIQLLQML